MAKKTGALKKRVVKVEPSGQAHVHSSFNNIIVTLTNNSGQVISWASAGKMGFKGSKKSTAYVAQLVARQHGAKIDLETRPVDSARTEVCFRLELPVVP